MPLSNSVPAGQSIIVKKVDAGGNTVTVAFSGGETADGNTTVALSSAYATKRFMSLGGAGWDILLS